MLLLSLAASAGGAGPEDGHEGSSSWISSSRLREHNADLYYAARLSCSEAGNQMHEAAVSLVDFLKAWQGQWETRLQEKECLHVSSLELRLALAPFAAMAVGSVVQALVLLCRCSSCGRRPAPPPPPPEELVREDLPRPERLRRSDEAYPMRRLRAGDVAAGGTAV